MITNKINKSIVKPMKIHNYVVIFNVVMGISLFLMLINWFLIDANKQKKSFIDLQNTDSYKMKIFSSGRQIFKYCSYGLYCLSLMILYIIYLMIFRTSNFVLIDKIID